jgi:hypothetical protein
VARMDNPQFRLIAVGNWWSEYVCERCCEIIVEIPDGEPVEKLHRRCNQPVEAMGGTVER